MLLLNAPARPRSLVTTTIRCVSSLAGAGEQLRALRPNRPAAAIDSTTSRIRSE
jgi:hypothetical protein